MSQDRPEPGATRREQDSLGSVELPADALWGAQTQRALDNFPISGRPLPWPFIEALVRIKQQAARVHAELGLLDGDRAGALDAAAERVLDGDLVDQFPVDVYQTGSGTSSNMNVNEVLARLAAEATGLELSPNDHVNLGQSSNDVVPSAIQVAAATLLRRELLPALDGLTATLDRRATELADIVKTGRTHLMDAMPLTLGQELGAWRSQLQLAREGLAEAGAALEALPLGGTAIGSGVNADPRAAGLICDGLAAATGIAFRPMADRFSGIAGQDRSLRLSAALRGLATVLLKLSNDLRWMNSGPLAGLGEIELPALQPGSSIMPGKVNPVIPEAVAMVCARVCGHDATVAMAAGSGNFQLNVMLPVIAEALIDSLRLLAGAMRQLDTRALADFRVRAQAIAEPLARNPILVTALNPVIGYARAAEIAKRAYAEGRPVLEVALEMTDLDEAALRELLDPLRLTGQSPEV